MKINAMKQFLTLSDIKNFENKKVLLRVDLNSAIYGSKIIGNVRFVEHAKTIKELINKKAKVVVLAHQGRPGEQEFTSLRQHNRILNKYVKIKFIDDLIGKKAINSIKKMKSGEALLLENTRFLKEEFIIEKRNKLLSNLSPLFDIFVEDALSICHREQTSITGFPKILPSYIGRVLEKELNALSKIKIAKKPVIYLIGGAKPLDYIELIESALKNNKVDKILACGLFGHMFLLAKGVNLGRQNKLLENKGFIKLLPKLIKFIKSHKIETPSDFGVNINGKRKEIILKDLPSKYALLDIGKKTIKNYSNIISKSKTILMKGTAGYIEDKKFMLGTKVLLKSIEIATKKGTFSLLGGGHLLTVIKDLNIPKFSYVSLSGGALMNYLSDKELPGLKVLMKK